MNKLRISTFAVLLFLLTGPGLAFAAATTQAVSGEVQMAPAMGEYTALAFGERVETGATIKTGPNGRVVLRFDDGQMLSISEGSLFVILLLDDFKCSRYAIG